MARIGHGYGSEWHLLRYLGRHRSYLDRLILEAVPGSSRLQWLDFEFDPAQFTGDRELVGLRFLADASPARVAWREVWPTVGNAPNWDAVARIDDGGWLLVEAKANLEELESTCKAKDSRSLRMIEQALGATQMRLEAGLGVDWKSPYYQLANRLVMLDHLVQHGENAHLLLIYFIGDQEGPGRTCPADERGWDAALARQQEALSLPDEHSLSGRIHKLFLDVRPGPSAS